VEPVSTLPRVAVVGQPNTGKSILFNRITGARAHVGNWPGITVDMAQATVRLDGTAVEFVDLPGVYDFTGWSEDEQVVRRFLGLYSIDLLIIVINATQIDRQVRMALQAKALGLPAVVMLNMADEAQKLGIRHDTAALAARLGMPVFLVSAKYGRGWDAAMGGLAKALRDRRGKAPRTADPDGAAQVREEDCAAVLAGAVHYPAEEPRTLTERIDRLMMHPWLGLPLFFATMLAVFWVIWEIGIPAQGWVGGGTDWIQGHLLEPALAWTPAVVRSFLVDGVWLGVATVASFVPLIVIFFFCMAAVEDSGYLSRAAYLMDAFMRRLGLDGRAFVMQMLGFGCNVPALMGTRIMRSRPLRLLSMLIIPFSLCSARLAVFVFIIAAIFPARSGPLVLFSFYVISFLAAFLAAAIFSRSGQFRSREPFVLELPPYRTPTLRQVLLRGWGELRIFLRRATNFIIVGCVAVWLLTNFPVGATGLESWGGDLGRLLAPVMAPIGIDPHLTLALIFGFIAKEVVIGSLSTIYALNADGVAHQLALSVTPLQAYSFCLFCLLYTPCLTTIATVRAESKSWGFTWFSLGASLLYAWGVSFVFYQGARLLAW